MKNKKSLTSRIRDRAEKIKMDLVSDAQIELHSNRFALISGCKKITEYSDEYLSMVFDDFSVSVSGRDLVPECLINGQMSLRGEINEVKYFDNKKTD